MNNILIKLMPWHMANPDIDITIVLPEELVKHSGGLIQDDGYDYTEPDEESGQPLLLYLVAADLKPALDCIIHVIETVPVLGNDLRNAALVAVETNGGDKVVYPADYRGTFTR